MFENLAEKVLVHLRCLFQVGLILVQELLCEFLHLSQATLGLALQLVIGVRLLQPHNGLPQIVREECSFVQSISRP